MQKIWPIFWRGFAVSWLVISALLGVVWVIGKGFSAGSPWDVLVFVAMLAAVCGTLYALIEY